MAVKPFTIAKFLDTLYGESTWHLPHKQHFHQNRMRAEIGGGYMNFTHFVQLETILLDTIHV